MLSSCWWLPCRNRLSWHNWHPDRCLAIVKALHASTTGPAYTSGEGAIKSTLSPGKLTDLTVLLQDIFAIDPMAIPETEVVATMFGGEFLHARGCMVAIGEEST